VDAGWQFTPSGHYPDGAEYDPKISGQPVRVPESEMPSALRYQYYRTNRFIGDYIPADADIARFVYVKEENGLIVEVRPIVNSIIDAVEKGDYSAITAPVQMPEPSIYLDAIMYQTQLISSWTSSYESHDGAGRNFNVAKLSGIINGVVIKPGEIWSINEEAGPRTYGNGWKGAPGIYNGAFVTEPGGGVCQISSTLYNAALRAGLEIVESSRHSVISNYIPLGLDATISTGTKDLKLKNPYGTPVFIVSYVNKNKKNVTVEIYGPPVTDTTHGEVILDFSSEVIERTEMPGTEIHYNAAETPDGKAIAPGSSKNFVTARRGTKAQVYIRYISLDGNELEKKKFYVAVYPKIEGQQYVNGPPPED
jgi:vancomycin resistance protein YoaR